VTRAQGVLAGWWAAVKPDAGKGPRRQPYVRWGGSNDLEAEARHREAEGRRLDLLARFRKVSRGFGRTHGRGDMWAYRPQGHRWRRVPTPRFLWLSLIFWLVVITGGALAVGVFL
jgi:hypothetical protein